MKNFYQKVSSVMTSGKALVLSGGAALAGVSTSATAAIPAEATAAITALETDVTSFIGSLWVLVIASTVGFIIIKLFKKGANKAT